MDAWNALAAELDAWTAAGRPATLWWRDDDAGAASPALARLLALARAAPLAIAAIPAEAGPGLAAAIEPGARVRVLQHGYAHRNHAAPGAKKCELGAGRARGEVLDELARGGERLRSLLPAAHLPVLVPPWNRIDPTLLAALPACGLRGLSTFGPRPAAAAPGLAQVNTHCDPIDWRGSRGFVGEARALGALVDHLAARRLGGADAGEPTGLLTHHRELDEDGWRFVERLLAHTRSHSAARWLDALDVFELRGEP